MSLRPYIPVDVENLPETFEFDFGEVTYNIQINYNTVSETFSLDIYTLGMDPIVIGEQLVLNEPLWSDCYDTRLPSEEIIPMDEAEKETDITLDNFGVTVFLFLNILSDDVVDQTNGVLNNG